jgi:hypothetical protein
MRALTRAEREKTGFTSVRVTKATAELLRHALAAATTAVEQQRRQEHGYRWWSSSGRRYGDPADVTMDQIVYERFLAAEQHTGDRGRDDAHTATRSENGHTGSPGTDIPVPAIAPHAGSSSKRNATRPTKRRKP